MADWQNPPTHSSSSQVPPPHAKPALAVITLSLMTINIVLFAWQVLSGVDIQSPSLAAALAWGADFAPLTYLQEPWRLLSSMFFHFGLPHLMFNVWALYVFGNLAEPCFGRLYFLCLYLLAGLMGSLLSGYIDIQNSFEFLVSYDQSLIPRISAGASGAVMGIGGALTALSFFPRLAKQRLALDKKSLLFILGINLAFGFVASGINNAAHIGGMLMGVIMASLWYLNQHRHWPRWTLGIIVLIGAALCYAFFQYNLSQSLELAPLWLELINQIKQL